MRKRLSDYGQKIGCCLNKRGIRLSVKNTTAKCTLMRRKGALPINGWNQAFSRQQICSHFYLSLLLLRRNWAPKTCNSLVQIYSDVRVLSLEMRLIISDRCQQVHRDFDGEHFSTWSIKKEMLNWNVANWKKNGTYFFGSGHKARIFTGECLIERRWRTVTMKSRKDTVFRSTFSLA
jgi:hypothetical protein